MHQDRFRISTNGLSMPPKEKSEKQEFLAKGYRLFMVDGSWYAEKDGDRIKVKDE